MEQSKSVIISPRSTTSSKRIVVIQEQIPRQIDRPYQSVDSGITALNRIQESSRIIVEKERGLSWAERYMTIVQPSVSSIAVRRVKQTKLGYLARGSTAVHYVEKTPIIHVEKKSRIDITDSGRETVREIIHIPLSKCPQQKRDKYKDSPVYT